MQRRKIVGRYTYFGAAVTVNVPVVFVMPVAVKWVLDLL